jgi:phage baseplate assembly protein W
MAIRLRQPIRIDPVDISERTSVGIKFPFNKKSIFDLDYTTKSHARSKLINLLITSPGERLNQPTFGIGMKNRLFEQQTPIAAEDLRNIINPQVQIYIPEIEIKNISIKDGGLQGHKLFITINYSMINDESEDSVSLSFTNENFQSNY